MYTRKKILYNLIKELGNPSNVVIQKSMFLLTHCNHCCDNAYDFFPHKMGCYSLRLRSDYHSLTDESYLEEDYDTNTYHVASKDEYTNRITFFVDKEVSAGIRNVVELVSNMNEDELIRFTYKLEPYYAIRSEIVPSLNIGNEFIRNLAKEKASVAESEKAIYTIGYEGRSIDGFINELVKRNIHTLFDVRKNAYSMQNEFSAQPLRKALDEAEIKYIHCPDVGIVSGKRQELLPLGRQDELFEWYKETILPNSQRFVDKAISAFQDGNIAFMCYEKDPMDCHRSRLADYCLNKEKRFMRVIHI